MSDFEAIRLEVRDHKAFVTLDRPEAANSFDDAMQRELHEVWNLAKTDPEIRVVVVTGAGDRAFCTGIDRYVDKPLTFEREHWQREDPSQFLSPKTCRLWKPVIGAVNGMACGGAFYILGECDIVIAAEHATFFDPHVTYALTAVLEPIMVSKRMFFAEALRMALLGNDERISAQKAMEIGLVSEVVPADQLMEQADWLASRIAEKDPVAIQGTVRTMWASLEMHRSIAMDLGFPLAAASNEAADSSDAMRQFEEKVRPQWRLR
jgi:enoyl-CoA hydratase/carnithine racemase